MPILNCPLQLTALSNEVLALFDEQPLLFEREYSCVPIVRQGIVRDFVGEPLERLEVHAAASYS